MSKHPGTKAWQLLAAQLRAEGTDPGEISSLLHVPRNQVVNFLDDNGHTRTPLHAIRRARAIAILNRLDKLPRHLTSIRLLAEYAGISAPVMDMAYRTHPDHARIRAMLHIKKRDKHLGRRPQYMGALVRIDQPSKATHGWQARLQYQSVPKRKWLSQFFADRKYGGSREAKAQGAAWLTANGVKQPVHFAKTLANQLRLQRQGLTETNKVLG